MNARPQTVEWLERYYRLLDGGHVAEAFGEYIADGCTFRVGSAPPASLLDEARRLAPLVSGVRHRIVSLLEDGDGLLACELEVTYIKHSGEEITLPGALFAHVRDGRFVEQRAYIDQAPLH